MTTQPQPTAAPPSSGTWETIKRAWKGLKDGVTGYISYIPRALLMSAAVLGGMIAVQPFLPTVVSNLLGIDALKTPTGFVSRLAIGTAVSMALAGVGGVAQELSHKAAPAQPAVPGGQAPQKGQETHVTPEAYARQEEQQHGLPPMPPPGKGKMAAAGQTRQ